VPALRGVSVAIGVSLPQADRCSDGMQREVVSSKEGAEPLHHRERSYSVICKKRKVGGSEGVNPSLCSGSAVSRERTVRCGGGPELEPDNKRKLTGNEAWAIHLSPTLWKRAFSKRKGSRGGRLGRR